MVKKKASPKNSNFENIFILIALIVLNIMLIVHFFIGVVGIIIGFIAAAFGMVLAGFIGFASSLFYPLIANSWIAEYILLGGIHPVAIGLFSLATFCFGMLWMIGNYYIVKYFVKATKWYLDLNIRVFKKYEL